MWGEAPVTSVSGELQMTAALCHCHGPIVLKHNMRKHCQWAMNKGPLGCLGFIGDERPLPSYSWVVHKPWHKDPVIQQSIMERLGGFFLKYIIFQIGVVFSTTWKNHQEAFFTTRTFYIFHNQEKLMERKDLRLNRGEDGLIASYTGQTGSGPWWNPIFARPWWVLGWKMFSIYRRLQGGCFHRFALT